MSHHPPTSPASPPARRRGPLVPLSVPEIGGNAWRYVKECLDTGWVSSAGAFVDRFERAMAAAVERRFAVATVNGTASLHVALRLCGIEPDDEVVVSTLTFIAPANAVRYVGAWPVFVDAEPDFWQMDVGKLEHFLASTCRWRNGALRNTRTGRRVRAILPVDVLGHPLDMEPIQRLAADYELMLIEDASESLGAVYQGARTGHFGDAACFSFNGNKIITSGGGGMLVTDREDWARLARHLTTQAKTDSIEFVHDQVGYNYRLTNLQAALGVAQLEQLDTCLAAKRRIARMYEQELQRFDGISVMREAPWAQSSFWMYTVLVDEEKFGMNARALGRALRDANIETRPLWQPLHLSPAHDSSFATDCSVAERLYATALSLPCSVGLTRGRQARVISEIAAVVNGWQRRQAHAS